MRPSLLRVLSISSRSVSSVYKRGKLVQCQRLFRCSSGLFEENQVQPAAANLPQRLHAWDAFVEEDDVFSKEVSDDTDAIENLKGKSPDSTALQFKIPTRPFKTKDKLMNIESAERLEFLWDMQHYCCETLAKAGRLVVFMKGTPLEPVDYYSQSVMLILKAVGIDIRRLKYLPFEEVRKEGALDPNEIYYFNVNDHGEDVKDLFRNRYLKKNMGTPHLYIQGTFVGSAYLMPLLYQRGLLKAQCMAAGLIPRI